MNREKKIQEMLKLAIENNINTLTLLSYLAFQTDKSITKFHKEFLEKLRNKSLKISNIKLRVVSL